jgi:hypothetical protein
MPNFPFKDPITVKRIGSADLEALLRGFEETWAETNNERISSAEFYERYRLGEVDSLFAAAWATYYEASRELERRRELHVDRLPGALIGA